MSSFTAAFDVTFLREYSERSRLFRLPLPARGNKMEIFRFDSTQQSHGTMHTCYTYSDRHTVAMIYSYFHRPLHLRYCLKCEYLSMRRVEVKV